MSSEAAVPILELFIGLPVLVGRWRHNFITRNVAAQHDTTALRLTITRTYSRPPYLDRQEAHQLLNLYNGFELKLNVSLLELRCMQSITIYEAIHTLLENWCNQVNTTLILEYGNTNCDHVMSLFNNNLDEIHPRFDRFNRFNGRIGDEVGVNGREPYNEEDDNVGKANNGVEGRERDYDDD